MINSNLVAHLQTPIFAPAQQPYPQSWGLNSIIIQNFRIAYSVVLMQFQLQKFMWPSCWWSVL